MKTMQPRLTNVEMSRVKTKSTPEGTPRTYGGKWMRIRAKVLRDEPLCRVCNGEGRITSATQVDHIVPLSMGGNDDRSNLQPICDLCHDEKSALEHKERRMSRNAR